MTIADLPPLNAQQTAASEALRERIGQTIEAAGGWISFDLYMQKVLYEPGLGYYSGGAAKLGEQGDFVTAPESGDQRADARAAHFDPVLRELGSASVVELGAGTGRLAARVIERLVSLGHTSLHYSILETSADLRDRQQRRLAQCSERVTWLDRLPAQPIDALIFGNEVADALPVRRFVVRSERALERGVSIENGQFVWQDRPADEELSRAVAEIEADIGTRLPDGYCSEVRPVLEPWIESLSKSLGRGALLIVDYGLVRREYYHPDRADGTLICHYRHRAHDDPFLFPGQQDLTAWVDFSACANAANAADLEVAGFTTQGQFLLESIARLGPGAWSDLSLDERNALKTMLLPGEMGEKFKLLWLTKAMAGPILPGRDFRTRL